MSIEKEAHIDRLTEEQRIQLLITSVSDYAIYMLNPDGYVNSWNTGAQRFKGYQAQEIIGRHFSVFYTPEDIAAGIPEKALRTSFNEGKFEAEGWRVRKDGTRFWASVVIDPIRSEHGQLLGYAKITRDITERMEAQQALRASEERFRLLVEGITDYAIYMLSTAGIVTNWNIGAEHMQGYSHGEAVGMHFSRFYTDEDQAAALPASALEIARNAGKFEREGWCVRKDGARFWAHMVIDAICNDRGELVGFVKITRDMTEKKRAEEALNRANAALFQSQKMEAIGQLTGGVAHDFNNLLAVMSSSLDVLSMQLTSQNEIKIIGGMQRAVARGATLTQQLLSFARQQPLKVENHNLNSVIEGFEAVLRRAVNAMIDFDINLVSGLAIVPLDAARFETALLNLIVNARDAMPQGGRLELRTANVELAAAEVGNLVPGRYVMVSLADTGTGMAPEVIGRAFEPFFTTKEIGKGTGLGLSQVYGFIIQSGGDVVLHSTVGKGTTVCIYLPVAAGTQAETNPDSVSDTEKVLIVEDEPDLLEVAVLLFRSMGYEVLTSSNGQDAIDILKRRQDIDILFADVMMPSGINGIELARLARNLYPAIRIILASGYPLPALKSKHGDLDEFLFVHKPYRLPELAKKLRLAAHP